MPSTEEAHSPSIQVIGRMFALLDALSQNSHAVALKTLSERTGLHPSTAHRILNDLALGGVVERPCSGHYRLGVRLIQLGNLVRNTLDVRSEALGPARELHRQTQRPVSLHVRHGDHLREWILAAGTRPPADPWIPSAAPAGNLHESPLGLLILAHLSEDDHQAYALRWSRTAEGGGLLTALSGLDKRSPQLTTDALGQRVLAALVNDDRGHAAAALTVPAGTGAGATDDAGQLLLQAVEHAAQRLSRALGAELPT